MFAALSGIKRVVMSHEVRRAQVEDAPVISALLVAAFLEYRAEYTRAGFNATTPSSTEVVERLAQGPIWLAYFNDEPVGTVSAVLQDDQTLYVRGMGVLPQARGMGIGKLLFNAIEEFATANHCRKLTLCTTPFLHRAIRLYERLGFVQTAEGPHDLFGTPLLSMEKLLSA